MASDLARLVTMASLLMGATQAGAGLGDIDANFGDGGRLQGWGVALVVLPDDHLVVIDGARVARFDANGKVDQTFGDGGEVVIPLPSTTPGFDPCCAAGTPDGGLVLAGLIRNAELTKVFEGVLRLDRDGHIVKSFGGRGDGIYRLPDALSRADGGIQTALAAFAVDAAGRSVLARRTWTADGRCNGPTSVMRLTSSGIPDSAFGTDGRADVPVDLCGGAALFGARNDGSIVVGARGTIVALDASGTPDPGFGEGGRVSRDLGLGVLMPDGGVLIMEADSSTASNALFTKLDRCGQPDPTFGAGTGSVRLDLGETFFGISGSRQAIHNFVLTPDAAHIYLELSVLHADDSTACAGGTARVFLDGTLDVHFGRQGLTCLDYGAFWFHLLAAQHNGSPLLRHQGWQVGGLYRLLADATPSPGMLTMVRNRPGRAVDEAAGTATVRVARTAGRDGAVSVSFATGRRHLDDIDSPSAYNATPGSDFDAASGRLDWADGDDAEREIVVTIRDDDVDESIERFSVGISNPEGGALGPQTDAFPDYEASVEVAIVDDDEAAAPTDQPPTSAGGGGSGGSGGGGGGGGGGSLCWTTLLAASGLLLRRQRLRDRPGRVVLGGAGPARRLIAASPGPFPRRALERHDT